MNSFQKIARSRSGNMRWKTPRKSTLVAYATPCVHELEDGQVGLEQGPELQPIGGASFAGAFAGPVWGVLADRNKFFANL